MTEDKQPADDAARRLDALVTGLRIQLDRSGDESEGTAEQRLAWLRANLGSHLASACRPRGAL